MKSAESFVEGLFCKPKYRENIFLLAVRISLPFSLFKKTYTDKILVNNYRCSIDILRFADSEELIFSS